ncbi:DUF350 domain-containing protein [Neptunomonas marina]|uniref:DUF350 domain-containing protein n=1 Tax=Neptunomonas marina TaxID=1815562 RepID=A0A437Q4E2_9GAMM|nr:DUF350 domain-containing protein [Neptunomonas marina]RVU29389.1 DUF350 domain-containing protein [Neptunomonas marina]
MSALFFQGLLNFAIYFSVAILLLIVFKFVYTLITPHDEWELIKKEQNLAASIGLGGSIVGFAIALFGVISQSVSLYDFFAWSLVALLAQCLAFAVVRFLFMPRIVQLIRENEVSAGVILGSVNIAVGLLNAASMTY